MNDERDGDDPSFREAMRDVRRLRTTDKRAPSAPKPPPRARFTRADQKEVLKESLLPPSDEAALATGDELSFRRPHIPEGVLTKLRRGQYVVDGEIDLHGMTGAEAKAALREFITEAVVRRMSCVRIVHGKGRRSGPRGPVLKNVVNQWLQRIDQIQAFGSARQVDGGSGAVYVLLKVKR
ncbi:Smr/MutS family protein [Steroidobacter sp.]|uniref:Smr/MutS family protein n=1 Tax=Steroidobacter sp. TaxID=1978227 RepID=UPI001A58EB7D|nr:Smr/MutS family protein [Steroidobacter sp.]MBL8269603.1 Smr/MutS family protein [Steroidobacter sp.]